MYKFMALVILSFVFILSACGGNSGQQESGADAKAVSPQFRSQLSDAVNIYFEIKDALVAADAEKAAEEAQSFKAALAKVDAASLKAEKAAAWQERLAGFQTTLDAITANDDIEKQRAAFLELSKAVIGSVKDFGPLNTAVYVQYCPMAFNNTGGEWLSNSKEILNPYFGDAMLHCGAVTETVEGKR